jgi:nucleotide-binding universal stress UspA family protein
MFTFMITGEPSANREQASRRVIIVGVDDSAAAEAAARWAVREAELRKADVLLVHAYDVPILGSKRRAAALGARSAGAASPTGQSHSQLDGAGIDARRPAHRN